MRLFESSGHAIFAQQQVAEVHASILCVVLILDVGVRARMAAYRIRLHSLLLRT